MRYLFYIFSVIILTSFCVEGERMTNNCIVPEKESSSPLTYSLYFDYVIPEGVEEVYELGMTAFVVRELYFDDVLSTSHSRILKRFLFPPIGTVPVDTGDKFSYQIFILLGRDVYSNSEYHFYIDTYAYADTGPRGANTFPNGTKHVRVVYQIVFPDGTRSETDELCIDVRSVAFCQISS